ADARGRPSIAAPGDGSRVAADREVRDSERKPPLSRTIERSGRPGPHEQPAGPALRPRRIAQESVSGEITESSEYDPRFLEGIAFFNDCDFFEAHEIWEDLWSDVQGSSRRFYQGLIQVAVCLHHFGNGNLRGAQKLYYSCRGYLEDYAPSHM